MERLTYKAHDGGIFVKESDVKTFDVEDKIMHTGKAIRKLAAYEDIEEHIGMHLKEFAKLCDKHIPDDCQNPGKAIVLTDEDAYEYERLKEMDSDPEKHEQRAEHLDKIKELRALVEEVQCALKAIGFLLGKENGVAYKLGYNKAVEDFVEKINYTAYTPVCADCMTKNQIIETAEQLKVGESE